MSLTRGHSHTVSVLDRDAFFLLTSSTVLHPPTQPPSYLFQPRSPSVTRTQTVEFAPSPQVRGRHQAKPSIDHSIKRQPSMAESRMHPNVSNAQGHIEIASKLSCVASCGVRLIYLPGSATFTQHTTTHTHRSSVPAARRGLGGFPMPHEIISSIVHKFFPNLERRIRRTVTIPVSQTLTSQRVESGQQAAGSRPVPYISFNALVGRNSTFHDLTREQIEELCGIEFKALNCLVWIVPCVRFHQSPRPPVDAGYFLPRSTTWFPRLSHFLSLRHICLFQSGNRTSFLPICIPSSRRCGTCPPTARKYHD